MDNRRIFALPDEETEYLNQRFPSWETINDKHNWLLIHDFPVPEGYIVTTTTVAIMLPTSYPAAKLDMVYFYPPLQRTDGKAIPAASSPMPIEDLQFQRWSRHHEKWDPNTDTLINHILCTDEWLLREFRVRP